MTEFLVCAGVPLVILNILWFSGSFRARKQLQYVSAQFQASAMEEWPRMTPDQIAWAVDEVFAQVGMGASEQQARWGSLGEQKLKWLAAGMYIRYCAMAPAGREREAAIRARTPGLLIAQVQGEEIFTWRQLLDERVYQANLHNSWQVCEQLEAAKFCLENPTDDPQFVVAAKTIATSTVATTTASRSIHQSLAWAEVLEQNPDPTVVTDANLRAAIVASGFAWRIRDNASNIEMLLIPAGTFTMGCSASTEFVCNSNEAPTHQVTLSAFYIGRYEVTQAQWQAKMGSNPSYFSGLSDSPSRPVERVSWNMIQGFNTLTGLRLPTEAEWEYAYRAGTTTAFHSYSAQPTGFNDDTLLENIAWFNPASGNQTHAVGGKLANGFGLHDMAGNVFEWCQDWYGPYSSGSVTNPTGPTTGKFRLLRGGDWDSNCNYCRASQRYGVTPVGGNSGLGFRVVRTP